MSGPTTSILAPKGKPLIKGNPKNYGLLLFICRSMTVLSAYTCSFQILLPCAACGWMVVRGEEGRGEGGRNREREFGDRCLGERKWWKRESDEGI